VRRPEVVGAEREMPRYPVTRTALVWQFYAVLYRALRIAGVPVMVVRYEDLLADPRGVVGRILEFGGLSASQVSDAIAHDEVRLERSHTVAGNPMRFQVGAVPLVRDDRWSSEMTRRDRLKVGLLTAWGRRWYGYR
jgi:Sulfotransferase domain